MWKKGRETTVPPGPSKRIFPEHDNALRFGIFIVSHQVAGKFVQRSNTMKTRTSLRKPPVAAFTLIELLTVIAIIAILMGLLFPVLSSVKNSARRQAAAVAIRNTVAACKSYEADYGKFPPVTAAYDKAKGIYSFGDTAAGGALVGNDQLFDILRSIARGPNVGNVMNTRQVKFFEMGKAKEPKTPRDGFVDGSDYVGTQGQLLDPWGMQYCFVLDGTGSGIDMSGFFTDLSVPANLIRQSAVGFSMGIDGKRGGKGYSNLLRKPGSTEATDDIVSWQ